MASEKDTRQQIIDKRLALAGWDVTDRTQVIEEFTVRKSEPLLAAESKASYNNTFSDYLLLGRDGKPLAVVEAKRTSKDAKTGREQAKQYCYGIHENSNSELPFCLYTNGHDIYFWNLENAPPQKVHGFPTRADFERLLHLRKYKKPLTDELINTDIAGRDYQLQAIRSITEGIEAKRNRFLLVMATGTGKTRTCIALVDALMRAGWIQRVLFLVDRVALRTQALDAFKEHLPDEPRWPHLGEKSIATDRRVYVATYPTMLNIVQDEASRLSPHFFDLIVTDESHRSIYNTYREILEYFNAIILGLTATPTDVIDHNTFEIFDCEDGVPHFAFSYDEAIGHTPPYLSDFTVTKLTTRFQKQGISQRTISLDDQMRLIHEGKAVEEINFEGTELEKTITNRGTNALIVREFMEDSIKDPNGVLPGKTIFFATSKKHAYRLEEIFNTLYPEHNGDLARVLVSEDSRVHGKGGLLDQFTHQDMPRIAISVDMLDTGIDVREIVNLVFAKPVFSYTKFWQMIGRGTRLLESKKLKPWCPEKDVFQILDCWDNFEYFRVNPRGREKPPQLPLPVRFVGIRIDKIEAAVGRTENAIAAKEIGKLRDQINELPNASVVIRDASRDLNQVQTDAFWKSLTIEKIEYLRSVIKPLFRTLSQVDFKAMRFEKDILETSLARLKGETDKYETLKDNIVEQLEELPLSVNTVAAEEPLIQSAKTNHYWSTATEDAFDTLSTRLAPLMRYRDTSAFKPGIAKFDFSDSIYEKETVEFGPEHEALSISRYRALVEERIGSLLDSNTVLQKLRSGLDISEQEADQLADTLYHERPHITLDLLRRAYQHHRAPFLRFIKHILGIEKLESFPDTVSKSIDLFISQHSTLTTRQLQFLNILRDYLIERGTLEKRDLIQAPFTSIHPSGIRGVFSAQEIDEILELANTLVA
ncbi:DEAD/DEAH box helicase family protein [Pelagicoccus sp. SDUM812002]|uniref:type I restriction endonuclease subunit R n=1 Tax=Pelagicoccus sp. SDUM812002 TaxID=3041266 RepID=UPI00280FCE4F|nr:DEAD/DEAH box helicase family protein [Pelagicoccus sp. SDUM812002]MDQ8187673.1 DEAD/DEAH box helicase family protein [Pelagicoccus sp. SDUM812002]